MSTIKSNMIVNEESKQKYASDLESLELQFQKQLKLKIIDNQNLRVSCSRLKEKVKTIRKEKNDLFMKVNSLKDSISLLVCRIQRIKTKGRNSNEHNIGKLILFKYFYRLFQRKVNQRGALRQL